MAAFIKYHSNITQIAFKLPYSQLKPIQVLLKNISYYAKPPKMINYENYFFFLENLTERLIKLENCYFYDIDRSKVEETKTKCQK